MTNILDLLNKKGELTPTGYELVKRYIAKWQLTPFEAMLETHIFSEDRLADQLADLYQAQRILSIDEADLGPESFQLVDYHLAKKLKCMIVKSDNTDSILVVAADPSDQELQSFMEGLGKSCELAIAEWTTLSEAIERLYPIEQQIPSLFTKPNAESKETEE